MSMTPTSPPVTRGLARILGWRRVLFTLGASALLALVLSPTWLTPLAGLVARAMLIGLCAMTTFGILETWPARLPRWLARWVLQILAVVLTVPLATLAIYWGTTGPGEPAFWLVPTRLTGFISLSLTGLLVAPWMAMSALLRQRDALVRDQALRFQLERSELERKVSDARLRLLQAQVQPHFLFNTLANVRALVNAGSPRARAVLDSLIAYLRAAVPRLDGTSTTLGQELQLVRAYLELMQLRMPDRLQFSARADPAAEDVRCPPMTLMTLVENAVRHGIDPSEVGGRIEIEVELREGRCHARVFDTGVGLQASSHGLGTGLSTLRERLELAFGGDAHLRVSGLVPHGVHAEVEFPALRSPE